MLERIYFIVTHAMEQSILKDLASQGNVEAIATLLNQSFPASDTKLQATLADTCLTLRLQATQLIDRTIAIDAIRTTLQDINCPLIETLNVTAYEPNREAPVWTYTAPLTAPSAAHPFTAPAIKTNLEASQFLQSLKTFRFSTVVPYRQALSSDLYSHGTVKLLLFFALFPLAIAWVATNTGLATGLEQTAWLLGVYYAFIWGVVLHNLIRPPEFSWQETIKCILFTVFVGIPLLLIVQQIPPFSFLYAATELDWALPVQLLGFILGVGVLEEVCKAIPIYLFLLRPNKLNDPLTSAFYGAMSGLGFAISEGVVYSVQYALGLVSGRLDFGSYVLVNTIRFVSLPLFHAIWAGIVGYFIGLAAINPSRRTAIVFMGVAIAAVLHGSYNTFGGLISLAIMGFSILLFVAYLRQSQEMVNEMKQAELAGLSEERGGDRGM